MNEPQNIHPGGGKCDFPQDLRDMEGNIPSCLLKDRYHLSRKFSRLKDKWLKGKDVTLEMVRLMEQMEESAAMRRFRLENVPELSYPQHLPVLRKKKEILEAIRNSPVLIVAGETGCGKTSQIPKICLEAGRGREGKIGCTQPRRVAATSIAKYIAGQVQGDPRAVSCQIRFHSTDSPYAYIKLMTDGILLTEIQSDRYLEQYDTIIIDEAHERTLNIDFLLGYLRKILKRRSDLRLIVSSATIDTESFSKFFDNAPVIEVSGRTYPVTVEYRPIDRELEESGDCTMIDAAVSAVRDVIDLSERGDILVFMPTEADIRETVDRLRGEFSRAAILPLFSRLTMEEQNRIFQGVSGRKIVVATNIAETSLTIPGIHYVVDTGYARISRYCPRTRTKRLPIETISRSSAEQRKGRCGRVEEGICIRLYAEDDLESREKFTPPEIRRSDLAEVILRMLYLPLGDITDFPFVDPPTKTAIRAGFDALRELGAIDDGERLTPMGKLMAELPTDPRTARILLAAKEIGALREVLVIAAALSIQDPRERPYDKQKNADEKHAQFAHKESDFMTYLNLWEKYHDSWEELKTQNKMRKFCCQNFLSYPRMREWVDLHEELSRWMERVPDARPAGYAPIHQAILSGFLGNIARRKEVDAEDAPKKGKVVYQARNQQELVIFPGSGLAKRQPEWIVAAEIVETSRLFARTVAQIDVDWVESPAKPLCRYSYSEPHWHRESGQVVAHEKVTLWGLVIVPRRQVHYGKIDRKESRDIFIREGLVHGDVEPKWPFLEANLKLIASVAAMENKIRRRCLVVEDWQLAQFYEKRLPDAVNAAELSSFIREHGDRSLLMGREHVLRENAQPVSEKDHPDHLFLGSQKLALSYHFNPGDPADGVTLHVPQDTLAQLSSAALEWLIPGWFADKVAALLKSLPKDLRKQLLPLQEKAREIDIAMPRTHEPLLDALEKFLSERYQVKLKREDWDMATLEPYLFMHFVVFDKKGNAVAAGRNLGELQEKFDSGDVNSLWRKAQREWFLPNLRNWCFGRLPESIEISPARGGIPNLAYPGLKIEDGKVNRTLLPSREEAEEHTRRAVGLLLEYSLSEELSRLQRALLSLPQELVAEWHKLEWARDLIRESFTCIKSSLLESDSAIRSAEKFSEKRKEIQARLLDIVPQWITLLREIIEAYRETQKMLAKPELRKARANLQQTSAEVSADLRDLLGQGFLAAIHLDRLSHYPRYLCGMSIRLERAIVDPMRDRKKFDEIHPYLENSKDARLCIESGDSVGRQLLNEYLWLLEEWKISLFAQELKTACPVSLKRVKQKWDEVVDRMCLKQSVAAASRR